MVTSKSTSQPYPAASLGRVSALYSPSGVASFRTSCSMPAGVINSRIRSGSPPAFQNVCNYEPRLRDNERRVAADHPVRGGPKSPDKN
jgi:hypothetical protein